MSRRRWPDRIDVKEVDAQGRPRWVLRQDCVTGQTGAEQWAEGYGPLTPLEQNRALSQEELAQLGAGPGRGAVSAYDPIAKFEGNLDSRAKCNRALRDRICTSLPSSLRIT
jgi:hypothetical protein